jgi:hypothetical protein
MRLVWGVRALLPALAQADTVTFAALAALTLFCCAPCLAESPPSEGVDEEVAALVKELRDLNADARCPPCRESHASWAEKDRQINDRFHALGSPAVPALARMLQSSLQGSDADLTESIFGILGSVSRPSYTSPDGSRHEKIDISAALPVLILALDDPNARWQVPHVIGAIGPKAAEAVPKLLALLDEEIVLLKNVRAAAINACIGLEGIDSLPALRRQARSDPNPDERQFAQRAIASIEGNCFGAPLPGTASPCDAPPYGDTPAGYKAFAQPYVSISLGPVKRLLQDMCDFKSHPRDFTPVARRRLGISLGISDEDLDKLGTVALVEKQLAAIETWTPQWEQFENEKGGDAPAELFLCFQPDGSCQRIPGPSTPINTLTECQRFAEFLGTPLGRRKPTWDHGRFPVTGAGAWYECRSK